MSVSPNDRRIQYTASGGETSYAYDFYIADHSWLVVVKNGTTLNYATHYTVSGVGVSGGGTIALVTAATAADKFTLYSAAPVQRLENYTADLLPSTLNGDIDGKVYLEQDLRRDVDLALRAPVDDVYSLSLTIPKAATRASKYLGFTAAGVPTALDGTGGIGTYPFSHTVEEIDDAAQWVIDNGQDVLDDLTDLEGRVTTLEGDVSTIQTDITNINTSITNITNGTTALGYDSGWLSVDGASGAWAAQGHRTLTHGLGVAPSIVIIQAKADFGSGAKVYTPSFQVSADVGSAGICVRDIGSTTLTIQVGNVTNNFIAVKDAASGAGVTWDETATGSIRIRALA